MSADRSADPPGLHAKASALFDRVRRLPPDRRRVVLDSVCADDLRLRSEVEALLAEHDELSSFLDAPPAPRWMHPSCALPQIDGYRVESVLGQGGMGVVYLATELDPPREVALKVLLPGCATAVRSKRIVHEAHVLARLQHPCIAQVFGTGIADWGSGPQPYFAMELVRGRPLVRAAREDALSLAQRVRCLAQICRAIHYAHEQGVVHRDLKPSNILIDERGAPKVLDFGIARTLDQPRANGSATATVTHEIAGTLAYASPEQLTDGTRAADARSDVYSIGVIAYELLAGRLPIELAELSLAQAIEAVREAEPAPLGRVDPRLRGDLECIVAKALEKDAHRRYASALELAEDLDRWLHDEPIRARRHSALYLVSKFARRKRPLVAGSAATLFALIGGLVATSRQAALARRERIAADEARVAAEREAQRSREVYEIARHSAAKTKAMYEFLADLIGSVRPNELGGDVRVVDVLAQAADRISRAYADCPEIEAPLRHTLGVSYFERKEPFEAEAHFRRALDLYRLIEGERGPSAVRTEMALGKLYTSEQRLDEAEPLLRDVFESTRDPEIACELDGARAANEWATLLVERGRYDEAEEVLDAALETARAELRSDRPVECLLMTASHLAYVRDRWERAAEFAQQAIETAGGDSDGDARLDLSLFEHLAGALRKLGRNREARPLYERAAAGFERRWGRTHPETVRAECNLALSLRDDGLCAEAAAIYEDALVQLRASLGATHVDSLGALNNLADLYGRMGENERAAYLFRELLDLLRASSASEQGTMVRVRPGIAAAFLARGWYAEAEQVSGELIALYASVFPNDRAGNTWVQGGYGFCLLKLGRAEEARPLLVAEYEDLLARLGPDDANTRAWRSNVIEACERLGRTDEAAALRAESDRVVALR